MTKAKLHCDIAHPNKKGLCNIRVRLFHKQTARFIQTKYYISPDFWDNELQKIKTGCKNVISVKAANIDLRSQVSSTEAIIQNTKNLFLLSANDLKQIIKRELSGDNSSLDSFTSYYKMQIEKMKPKPGSTDKIYEATLNRINKYTSEVLFFETINKRWLENYQQWAVKENLAPSTQTIDFRNIRAIFNKALDETPPIISLEIYPFGRRGFKIPKAKTKHRDLSLKQFRQIFNYTPQNSREELGQDAFMLSFLLLGINNIDLYELENSNISNTGRLTYERSKTKRDYSIKIHPYAFRLIQKYRGNQKLLNFIDRYKDINGFTKGVNIGLKSIAKNLDIPNLTMYYARHSWATFAAELEIPKETIAAGLGHGKKEVTDIYINFNSKKVDKANKKVIKYTQIFSEEKPKKKSKKKQKL